MVISVILFKISRYYFAGRNVIRDLPILNLTKINDLNELDYGVDWFDLFTIIVN